MGLKSGFLSVGGNHVDNWPLGILTEMTLNDTTNKAMKRTLKNRRESEISIFPQGIDGKRRGIVVLL